MAGAAEVIRDWWESEYGVMSPGDIHAAMLLMGDRSWATRDTGVLGSGKKNIGFDERMGAGRIRARIFNYDGMAPPSAFSAGSVCVQNGTNTQMFMTNTSSDVDMIRAVAWWYDHGHDDGLPHAKVDLRLVRKPFGSSSQWIQGSSATNDHKQRIHLDDPAPGQWYIRLSGRDIQTDVEGCGLNSTRVHFAWFAESEDRPSSNNLFGVRPE